MNKAIGIIVHYGNVKITLECLESIYQHSDFPIIVVNNSLDIKLENSLKKFPHVTLINPSENLGFAKANNLALQKGLSKGAEYLILLNNDTLIPAGFFKKIISFADSGSKLQIISPKIYFAPGYEFHKGRYAKEQISKIIWYAGGKIDWNNIYASHRGVDEVDHGQYDKVIETEFATGCCLLIPKQVLTKIGFLPEEYFLYYEDVDYSLKAKNLGIKVIYFPFTAIYHKNAVSSQGSGSVIHQYYQNRNRLIFGMKFAPLRIKLALFRQSIKLLMSGGISGKAVIDFYLHRFGKRNI